MPRKYPATKFRDYDDPATPDTDCPSCLDANPHLRHRHYLRLAQELPLDAIEAHLRANLSRRLDDQGRVQSYAKDILVWLAGKIAAFAGMVDEDTGARLPWWEAMKHYQQEMQNTYDDLAEDGMEQETARGGWRTPGAPWQPISWDELAARRAQRQTERRKRRGDR